MKPASARAAFITIPLSHYCEKARWGLDRAAFPYVEETHAPLFSRRVGGTVPVLVQGEQRFTESTDILVHADQCAGGDVLYPRDDAQRAEVSALEEHFDTGLGPHTRRWAYSQILAQTELLRKLWSRDVPDIEGRIIRFITPLLRPLVRNAYNITPDAARRSEQRVHSVFEEVGDRLRDGRPYLVGQRFTAADLSFAALAAPVLLPTGCRAVQPTLDEIPSAMRELILRMRETPAGAFALRMFAQER